MHPVFRKVFAEENSAKIYICLTYMHGFVGCLQAARPSTDAMLNVQASQSRKQ